MLKLEAIGRRGIDLITADTSKPFIIDNDYNVVLMPYVVLADNH